MRPSPPQTRQDSATTLTGYVKITRAAIFTRNPAKNSQAARRTVLLQARSTAPSRYERSLSQLQTQKSGNELE